MNNDSNHVRSTIIHQNSSVIFLVSFFSIHKCRHSVTLFLRLLRYPFAIRKKGTQPWYMTRRESPWPSA